MTADSRINIRLYVGALVSTLVALALFRFFAIPWFQKDDDGAPPALSAVAAEVANSLLGATLAALGISILAFILWGRRPGPGEVEVITPGQISGELLAAAREASSWTYKGHTGRYFRTAILPVLSERSRQHGRYIDIRVQLLDPTEDASVRYFVRYRREVNPERRHYWNEERARAEIIATIIAVGHAACHSARLSAEVRIGGTISPFTHDLAPMVAITTRESSRHTALKYPPGSTFYDSVMEDLHLQADQARLIRLPADERELPVNDDEVRDWMDEVGLPDLWTPSLGTMIADSLRHPTNPYEDPGAR